MANSLKLYEAQSWWKFDKVMTKAILLVF